MVPSKLLDLWTLGAMNLDWHESVLEQVKVSRLQLETQWELF